VAYPRCRFVVTSRISGYDGAARLGEGYNVTTVRDFTLGDVEKFVRYWTRAVEVGLAGASTAAVGRRAREQAELLLAAIRGSERVRDLARNPLLLTVIALVHRYRPRLPERRSELYEEAVEVLLGAWDEAKGLSAKTMMAGRALDAGDRRALLEPVALWMQERQAREIGRDELRALLRPQFAKMTGDEREAEKATDEFIRLIDERSGLLQERGQAVYGFSHLTFQEHLAARVIASRDDFAAYALARLGDSWWRETILLTAGVLSLGGKPHTTQLIRAIMDARREPEPFYNLVLAAEALRDVGLARVEGDLGSEIYGRVKPAAERAIPAEGRVKDTLRSLAGMPTREQAVKIRISALKALLAIERVQSGKPSPFWREPFGEPEWVDVPAGEFWMGSESAQAYDDEKPIHRVHLPAYSIARTPITNAQYAKFVQAQSHGKPRYWRDGVVPAGEDDHPVVGVNWFDARAYCEWLSDMTGKTIRLPTEAEWEKAARGSEGRREFPWGDAWLDFRANTSELDLGNTTPVGLFPAGASPCGALDMVGNVWEWTSTLRKNYPYRADDGREDMDADGRRVLRGGSWSDGQRFARCACRSDSRPDVFLSDVGFRVVCVPG
jgi:formylglycine-generating enzyme required for sulfatase activity